MALRLIGVAENDEQLYIPVSTTATSSKTTLYKVKYVPTMIHDPTKSMYKQEGNGEHTTGTIKSTKKKEKGRRRKQVAKQRRLL